MPQIYDLLQEDHRKVKVLLQSLESADKEDRDSLIEEVREEFDLHMQFEETIFYPEIRSATGLDKLIEDGIDEHQEARTLLEDLMNGASESKETWKKAVESLQKAIDHHVEDEETKMFPAARKAVADGVAEDLGEQYEAFKEGNVEALED